jgi:hypothetical protein
MSSSSYFASPISTNTAMEAPMPATEAATTHRNRKDARKDSLGFRLIYSAAFATFLVAAVADRLIPLRWLVGATGQDSYLGVLTEARRAAETFTPFAFMG